MTKLTKKKLFLTTMILSIALLVSSTKWLSIWLALEMNLMVSVPIIFSQKSKELSEKCMIYFLMQVMASILFLTLILTLNFNKLIITMKLIMTMIMMIKMGSPPFHIWMPEMISKLNWNVTLIMITIQKIPPLFIISQLMEQNMIMPKMIMLSGVMGAIMGLNQVSLNKIMAYSSMVHISWMMMSMMTMNYLWMKYFLIYTMITSSLCMFLKMKNMFFINQLNLESSWKNKIMISLMLINLGGLPPLPGFFMKWVIMESTLKMINLQFVMLSLLMASMVTLLFYMRMLYKMIIVSSVKAKHMMTQNKKTNLSSILMIINMIMPMMTLI